MTRKNEAKMERKSKLRWIPVGKATVAAQAQRELNHLRVAKIKDNFKFEMLGFPIVSERDGGFFIIDGQHRIEAFRQLFGENREIQCQTYTGLTEQEEADYFLMFNDAMPVSSFDKFRVGVAAEREEEDAINKIVEDLGLTITRNHVPGKVYAVATLRRVYRRGGPDGLARTLATVRDAFGDIGLRSEVIDGIGLVYDRYTDIDNAALVKKLSTMHGGVSGLIGKARELKYATGKPLRHCVAASTVDAYNRGTGRRRIKPWFRYTTR